MREPIAWPMPGGLLARFGLPPAEIEERSRRRARALVSGHWSGEEAELAASLVYATGDPSLVADIRIGGDPVACVRRALAGGAGILVDVRMVAAGLRLSPGRRFGVAVDQSGAAELAHDRGVTRAAAGIRQAWDGLGVGGLVAIGNAPTALLAALDLAASAGKPACVVATCPGLHLAAEAKAALAGSDLAYVSVAGSRGGSGMCAAAINALLSVCGGSDGHRP